MRPLPGSDSLPIRSDVSCSPIKVGVIYNSFWHKSMSPEECEMKSTGLSVGKHLRLLGHDVQFFDIDSPTSIEALCRSRVDVAFDVCERVNDDPRGEAYVAGLLEYLDIPHTRTRSWQILLGVDKTRIKAILSFHGIATPNYQIFCSEAEPLRTDMTFPLFVKSTASENSIGIDEHSLVHDANQLTRQLKRVLSKLKRPALVERYIDGREINVAILPGVTPTVLPIAEIEFGDLPRERRYLDYSSKWFEESEQCQKTIPRCPANLSVTEQRVITETARKCYEVLGLNSYVRVDIRFKDGIPYILEINQNPSIGEDNCGYVRSCERQGLDYTHMLDALLRNAIRRSK
jgi:D-alanine-D-alanine ligase